MAANDEAAIGVLMRLRDRGVDVPGQVSVAGIDDTRPAHFVGLTTVSVPLHEMGRRAAHTVLGGYNADDVVLPHRVIPRATTAPALEHASLEALDRQRASAPRAGRSQIAGLRISTSIGPQ